MYLQSIGVVGMCRCAKRSAALDLFVSFSIKGKRKEKPTSNIFT